MKLWLYQFFIIDIAIANIIEFLAKSFQSYKKLYLDLWEII